MKRKPKSFQTKLWLYFMLFTAIIFTVLWLLQTVFLQSFYHKMLISNTKKTAEMIAQNSNSEEITDRIDLASVSNSMLIYITDVDGTVLYFSDEYNGVRKKEHLLTEATEEYINGNKPKKKHIENFRNLPEDFEVILTNLNDGDSTAFEYTTENFYNYGTYIDYYNTQEKAILYVRTTLDPVGSTVAIIRFQLIWVTLFSLIAGFIPAWFIARSFGRPVAQLSEKAKYLGESHYPKEFQEGFCIELDDLSHKLDNTSDKLIEAHNFQTELLANVSHDLRTPLTMIKGYAELIGDTSWNDEEQCKSDIAVIVREADRLTELVNEILEYSELKTGDIPHHFDKVNLSELTAKVCRNFEDLYKGKEETIEIQIENGVYVNGHRQSFKPLRLGDEVFIMGLRIIVGVNYLALNNATGRVKINTPNVLKLSRGTDFYSLYSAPVHTENSDRFFDRPPRKLIKVEPEPIEIEMPPMKLGGNRLPLLLRLGSPLLMGGQALMTGNYLSAMTSMVLPSAMQGMTEKDSKEYEAKRIERYGK